MESYNKSFVNGRSHHMPSRDQDQEEEKPSQVSDETESDVSSSSCEGLREKNMVNLTRKRSKRTRKLESFTTKKMKMMEGEAEHEPHHSSASDTTTEEDLAFCLMMLSRDKWKKKKKKKNESCYQEEEIETEESEEGFNKSCKTKGRYKCETCGKVFKSYQALGGHRASHKKNKVCSKKTEFSNVVVVAVPAEKRIHECPICLRVFASGQALGGHKRSHGIANSSVNHHRIESVKQRMIDLNLPAPNEEEEVSVVFQ